MKNPGGRGPVSAVIVGAGHRAFTYADYALTHPGELKITGVADPNPLRRETAAKRYGFGKDRCFETAGELAAKGKLADAVINGTMDHQHVATSLPLLEQGYDLLLEKPFAVNETEMWRLLDAAERSGARVMICHVLRYAPFYAAIRQKIIDGAVGDIINIQANEHVSFHHTAVGYVRGKWNNTEKCRSTMLLSKSCHDMDLIMWMKSGVRPKRISSHGGNFQFNPSKRPVNAGKRCLVDCPIEAGCVYSAKKHYIDNPDRWSFYVWDCLEHIEHPSVEQKIESLKTGNAYGRCVWDCDNNVVDHQSVLVEFEDGATGTFNMTGGAARGGRSIHIIGTKGEITGDAEDSKFAILNIEAGPAGKDYSTETVDLNTRGDTTGAFGAHGGGDLRLVNDFVRLLRGEAPSISCTSVQDSVSGHLAVFRADLARERGCVVSMEREL
jgi:predicted dehydrogenase